MLFKKAQHTAYRDKKPQHGFLEQTTAKSAEHSLHRFGQSHGHKRLRATSQLTKPLTSMRFQSPNCTTQTLLPLFSLGSRTLDQRRTSLSPVSSELARGYMEDAQHVRKQRAGRRVSRQPRRPQSPRLAGRSDRARGAGGGQDAAGTLGRGQTVGRSQRAHPQPCRTRAADLGQWSQPHTLFFLGALLIIVSPMNKPIIQRLTCYSGKTHDCSNL